jgi:RNA polymerase sporulation-specific sigma factor
VLSLVNRFSWFFGTTVWPDDLFQVGCIGLIKAIDNFDLKFNVKFSTYAVPMILGEIRRYLRDNNLIKVSRHLRERAYKIKERYENLCMQNKALVLDALAQQFNVSVVDVFVALDVVQPPLSLYEPSYYDNHDRASLIDRLADQKEDPVHWTEGLLLKESFKKLGDRERLILAMRFGEGRTQVEIANEIGISQAQVSRIEKSVIKKFNALDELKH